jgi:uncharacterized membrane protein YadS
MMQRLLAALAVTTIAVTSAWADEAPEPIASSPWGAAAIFAVVIGMIAAVIIWRRRR